MKIVADGLDKSLRRNAAAVRNALGGETAVVTVRNGKAEIRGARFRALLFGTGALLKSIVWKEGSFELADGELRFQPAKKVRMSYAARHFLNWYMEAPVEEVLTYLEDLVLDGLNSFMIQYAMPVADLARASKEETAAFEANSRRIAAHIAALDCDYCLNIGWKMQIMLRNAQVHKMSIKYSEATTQYIIEQLGGKIDAKSIQYKDRVSVTKN